MNNLLPILLSWFQSYGYPILWLTTFVAAIGAPLPLILMLLAAGAWASSGNFNLLTLFVVALTASVAGDCTGYLIGRLISQPIIRRMKAQQHILFLSPRTFQRSQRYFRRSGGLAIFLSRFLITALGGPINILAGAELYPFWRFLVYDTIGEILCVLPPLILGYYFGESWEEIGTIFGTVSFYSLLIVVSFCLLLYVFLLMRKNKIVRLFSSCDILPDDPPIADVQPKTSHILPL